MHSRMHVSVYLCIYSMHVSVCAYVRRYVRGCVCMLYIYVYVYVYVRVCMCCPILYITESRTPPVNQSTDQAIRHFGWSTLCRDIPEMQDKLSFLRACIPPLLPRNTPNPVPIPIPIPIPSLLPLLSCSLLQTDLVGSS